MKQLKNTLKEFGSIAKFLHWFMACAIIGMLIVGFIMTGMQPSSLKWTAYTAHKSTGVLLMALVAIRLIWKFLNLTPQLTVSGIKGFFARLSVYVLYLAMITMVVSGFIMSDAGGYAIKFFDMFTLPFLFEKNPELSSLASQIHNKAAFTMIGILCLHILAAFYHHIFLKDTVLVRMLPRRRKR